jgi:hypothetical protein
MIPRFSPSKVEMQKNLGMSRSGENLELFRQVYIIEENNINLQLRNCCPRLCSECNYR